MTDKVYRVLSFKASLLLLASKPLNLLDKTLNNSGSKLGGASRSLKAYNTRSWKLACKGLELRRVSIFCKKDYILRLPAFLYRLQNLGDQQGLPSLFRLTSLGKLVSNPLI